MLLDVRSHSHVWLCATPWTAASQASLSLTISKFAKFMSIASVKPSSHLILWRPLLLLLSIFPASGTFPMSQLFASGDQNTGASAQTLPTSIQSWFPLRLTDLTSLLSRVLSGVFSSTTVRKHQFFGALSSLWSSSHNCTIVHGHWDHSLDYKDLCQQNNVSAFPHCLGLS